MPCWLSSFRRSALTFLSAICNSTSDSSRWAMRFLIWAERANGEPDHAGKGHRSKRQMLRPLQSLRIEHNRTSLIASELLTCRISGCGVC